MSDLCSRDDVVRYVPGYDQTDPANADTNDTLDALITALSVEIIERTGREFAPISPALDPRVFDVSEAIAERRRLPIGDASAITSIEQHRNGSLVEDFDVAGPDAILLPRVRQPWKPYTAIWFPTLSSSPALLQLEDTFQIAGTWGHPSVPSDIVQACAKLVLVRYLIDPAHSGTALADAVSDDVNIGGMFVSAEAVIKRYEIP